MNIFYKILILFFITFSNCIASEWTTIRVSDAGIYVQCNGWGWTNDYWQTWWQNDCTPLEVKVHDKIYSITTTQGICPDSAMSVYEFIRGDEAIRFKACL